MKLHALKNSVFHSPLRYPGGKRKLVRFIKLVFTLNKLTGGQYAEPYAGGASVALALLFDGYASQVHINDIDEGVYSFWESVLEQTEALNRLIQDTPVTMEQWHKQRAILMEGASPQDTEATLALGFATFFLNRTNRSGIIRAGVIGGKEQRGEWKLGVRFNQKDLINRIDKIAKQAEKIHLTNLDATDFLKFISPMISGNGLIYLDPPYYDKGPGLYHNSYEHVDHEIIASDVSSLEGPWIVSYDNSEHIAKMYNAHEGTSYGLSYTAQDRYKGRELMFFSDGLARPEVENPSKITLKDFRKLHNPLGF
jgi:DNA adenine methylase